MNQAARLLAELGDDAPIGIVLDPANLLIPQTVARQDDILNEAVDLLGPRILGIQAKDVVSSDYSAVGAGLMDYVRVFEVLARVAPVPVIVQDASAEDAPLVRDLLTRAFALAFTT